MSGRKLWFFSGLLNAGCNLSRDLGGLAYTLRESVANVAVPVVAWEDGAVHMSADEALAAEARPEPNKTAVQEAEDWLRAELANDPVDSAYINSKAAADGIAPATLQRARKKLGVRSVQERCGDTIGRWRMTLPKLPTDPQGNQGAHTQYSDNVDSLDNVDNLGLGYQGYQGNQGYQAIKRDA